MTNPPETFTLPRTGEPDCCFNGLKRASAKSPAYRKHLLDPGMKCHWFEVDVYETVGGKYVLHFAFRWDGDLYRETNGDEVHVCDSLEDVVEQLEAFEPKNYVQGFPRGSAFAEKQKRLMDTVDDDYDLCCQDVHNQVCRLSRPERIG